MRAEFRTTIQSSTDCLARSHFPSTIEISHASRSRVDFAGANHDRTRTLCVLNSPIQSTRWNPRATPSVSEGCGGIPVRTNNHLRALQSPDAFTTSTSCSQILAKRPCRIGHNVPGSSRMGLIVASRKTLETTFVARHVARTAYVRHLNMAS